MISFNALFHLKSIIPRDSFYVYLCSKIIFLKKICAPKLCLDLQFLVTCLLGFYCRFVIQTFNICVIQDYFADEIGVLSPSQLQVDELYAGEVCKLSLHVALMLTFSAFWVLHLVSI